MQRWCATPDEVSVGPFSLQVTPNPRDRPPVAPVGIPPLALFAKPFDGLAQLERPRSNPGKMVGNQVVKLKSPTGLSRHSRLIALTLPPKLGQNVVNGNSKPFLVKIANYRLPGEERPGPPRAAPPAPDRASRRRNSGRFLRRTESYPGRRRARHRCRS
jgi:hypothetical protein